VSSPGGLFTAGGPGPDLVDPPLDLLRAGLRDRRTAAGPAQLAVDHPVRAAGPVVPGPDQGVELLAQLGGALVGRRLGRLGGRLALGGPLLGLALAKQLGDLLRLQQAGQSEEVLLLRRPGGPAAELGPVVEGPVE